MSQIGADDEDPTRVYALTKDNLERIVIDTIRNTTGIGPAFEQQLLQAVRKEVALALKRVLAPNSREIVVNGVQHSESINLEIKFLNKPSHPVFTGKKLKGEDGSACLKIALVELGTDKIIDSGPEASATVEIGVIPVHPDGDESFIPACKSLLAGSRFISLKEGIGLLDDIYFAHKRSWRKRCQLMLEANTVGKFDRVTIKGAKSQPFMLRDCRLPLYEKHHPPSLSDKVWRLNNISKGGTLQKRLSEYNIETVEDFLKEYHINPQQLQEILGPSMSSKKLNDTVRHGLECRLEETFLYCLPDSQQKPSAVLFNRVGQVLGLQYEHGSISPVQGLSQTEKDIAQNLVVSAFAHWENVIPHDVNETETSVLDYARPSTSFQGINSSVGWTPKSPTAVFDHARPQTSFQGINSSAGWTPKSPTAVFDHARPQTSFQGINSSAGWTPKSPVAVLDHAQPTTFSQGINSSTAWTPKSPTAMFDHAQPKTSFQGINSSTAWTPSPTSVLDYARPSTSFQGINSSAGVSNFAMSATRRVYDHLGLAYSENTDMESLPEPLGDQYVIQENNLDDIFQDLIWHLGTNATCGEVTKS